MNKTLLISSAFMLMAASSWADDRTQPVYSGEYSPLSTTDTVYIFNTDKKAFLTEGNDYGTHASVGTAGLKFAVKQYLDESGQWDGSTYIIYDYSVKKAGWKQLFITDGGHIYVDASAQATDLYYNFEDLGNNTYRIKGADLNPTWKSSGELAGYYVGLYTKYVYNSEETGNGVIFDTESQYDAGDFLTTWAFVSQANYADYEKQLETYNVATTLLDLIEANKSVIDVKDEQAVYDNQASTVEQLNAAIESVKTKLSQYYETTITPSTPLDYTSQVANADGGSVSGWTNDINASTWNTQTWIDGSWSGFEGTTLNIWSAKLSGKAYQTLTGLPNGIYVVSLAAYSEKMDGYVYANDNKKSVAGAAAGNTYSVTTNVTGGTLEFGFGQDEEGTNWVALDNASVVYYGSGVEAYRFWLNSLLESAPSFDDVTVQDSLVTEYKKVLASVNTVTTKDEILNIIPSYEDILNKISVNTANYANLVAAKDSAEILHSSDLINTYYADLLNDYITSNVTDVLDEHTLGNEAVIAITNELNNYNAEAQNYVWNKEKLNNEMTAAEAIYTEYSSKCSTEAADAYNTFKNTYSEKDFSSCTNDDIVAMLNDLYNIEFNLQIPVEKASDTNPVDYTAKVQYPSFDNGAEGWTNDGFSTCGTNTWNSFADGEVIDKLYLNLWNEGAASVYQTITDLPNGAYTVQYGAYSDAEGFELFANERSISPVTGKNEDGQAKVYHNSLESAEPYTSESGTAVYYGNIYQIDVVVTDGTLTIGGRIPESNTVWAMIDNVKVTYYGTDSQIVTGICMPQLTENVKNEAIYTVSGVRTNKMQKGLNIVKMTDGSVKKIMAK